MSQNTTVKDSVINDSFINVIKKMSECVLQLHHEQAKKKLQTDYNVIEMKRATFFLLYQKGPQMKNTVSVRSAVRGGMLYSRLQKG